MVSSVKTTKTVKGEKKSESVRKLEKTTWIHLIVTGYEVPNMWQLVIKIMHYYVWGKENQASNLSFKY